MATIMAKGSASISVNAGETEAKLVFTPDPEGLGWDLDAVNKLVMETGLSPPPSPKLVEPFLQKASRAKDKKPMELLLYEGTPPEEPVPEAVAWESLPIPPDMAPYQAETLGKAPAPELFRVRIERIKKECIVKKPGPLPFLPPKEEVVVSWDKKEIREAVQVNPEPREVMYAERGKKLGVFAPPKPGKPGKSVFGKPLLPAAGGEGTFLLGKGISREKNEAAALYSGFLRIGENWADIVPLSKPSYTITTGSDGLTLFFNFVPGDPRFPPPKGDEILAEALSQGANREILVSARELDDAIGAATGSGDPVEAFPLFAAREAEVRVDINQDQTRATLYLRKGIAGALPLEIKAVNQAIRDSGVAGFDAEKLRTVLKTFMEGKEIELKDYVLAEGSPSSRGKDREVQLELTPLGEEITKPLLERLKGLPKGGRGSPLSIAPGEASALALVEKGTVVAQVTSSSEGEAGKDISARSSPAFRGTIRSSNSFGAWNSTGQRSSPPRRGSSLSRGTLRVSGGRWWTTGTGRRNSPSPATPWRSGGTLPGRLGPARPSPSKGSTGNWPPWG
jgi:hypothetical protein